MPSFKHLKTKYLKASKDYIKVSGVAYINRDTID